MSVRQPYPVLTNAVTGSGASGQVTYWNSTSTITGDSNFTWNRVDGALALSGLTDSSTLLLTNSHVTSKFIFSVNGPLSTDVNTGKGFSIQVIGEAFARAGFYTDGKFGIGSGTATRDVFLSRSAVNTFTISSDGASGSANLLITGLTASKVVFTDASKVLTSTGIGTAGQFIKGDGSLDSTTYLSGTKADSVSNSDGTLTISPTTGAVVASLALAHANTWTGQQTFNTSTAIFGVAPTFSTLTAGQNIYTGTGGIASSDANWLWDSTNQRASLGIAGGQTASLAITPKVSTDAGITIQGASSQSAVLFQLQDSAANLLANFNKNGALIFTNTVTTTGSLSDSRTFTTAPSGNIRGYWAVSPTLNYTALPNGTVPTDSIFIGMTDSRTVQTSSTTNDNLTGMEFNISRTVTFNDAGQTGGIGNIGAVRNFQAIKTSMTDGGIYTDGTGTKKNTTVTTDGWAVAMSGSYVYNSAGAKSLSYQSTGLRISQTFTPTLTAGTLVRSEIGVKVNLTGTATGTSTGIGSYVNVATYTNNYGFVNASAANNYLGFNNSKSLFGGTAFVLPINNTAFSITGNYGSIYYDGTNLIINPSEVGTSNLVVKGNTDFSTFNIITDTVTGTQIGTATTQKLGFFGSTPIVQEANTVDLGTVLSDFGFRAAGGGYPITTSGVIQGASFVATNSTVPTVGIYAPALGKLGFSSAGSEIARISGGGLSVLTGANANYAIDVTGDINASGAFRQGGVAGIDATVTYVDTLLGAKTLTFKKGILTAQV